MDYRFTCPDGRSRPAHDVTQYPRTNRPAARFEERHIMSLMKLVTLFSQLIKLYLFESRIESRICCCAT